MNPENTRGPIALNFEFPHMDKDIDRYPLRINWRLFMGPRMERFIKRNGVMIVATILLTIWTWTTCAIAAHNAREIAIEELSAQYAAEYEAKLQAYKDQQQAANFVTGAASFEAAVNDFADQFDELIATYSMDYGVTEDGCRTIAWVYCSRDAKKSTEFGTTPQEILEKPGAWEGNVIGHAVRDQDTAIAREIAREYLSGHYPDGYTPDLLFFNREAGGKIIARNELYTGPYTAYWWYGK